MLTCAQGLLGTYLYVPVEVSEDYPGEKHTKPQNVKVFLSTCIVASVSYGEALLREDVANRSSYNAVCESTQRKRDWTPFVRTNQHAKNMEQPIP